MRYLRDRSFLLAEGFIFQEIVHQIEDGAVKDIKVHLDGFVANGLGKMRFPNARRSDKKYVGGFADEGTGGQFVNLFAIDGGVKLPVELFQRFQVAKVSRFGAAFEHPFLAHGQFILKDEFQEVRVAQPVRRRFLEPDWQRLHKPGQAQLFQGLIEDLVVHICFRLCGGCRLWDQSNQE